MLFGPCVRMLTVLTMIYLFENTSSDSLWEPPAPFKPVRANHIVDRS